MWYGKTTEELKKLNEEYYKLFGVLVHLLQKMQCQKNGRSSFVNTAANMVLLQDDQDVSDHLMLLPVLTALNARIQIYDRGQDNLLRGNAFRHGYLHSRSAGAARSYRADNGYRAPL